MTTNKKINRNPYIIFAFFLGLFCNCKENPKSNITTDYFTIEDLVENQVPIIEIEQPLALLVDSLIPLVVQCEKFDNLPLSYIIEIYEDTLRNFRVHISSNVELFKVNYSECIGVSYYKGYEIVLFGKFLDDFYTMTDQKTRVFFVSPDKENWLPSSYGEFFNSTWDFFWENNSFKNYHFNHCNQFWNDPNYLKSIKSVQ